MSLLLVPAKDQEGDKADDDKKADETDSDGAGIQPESTESANTRTEAIRQQGEATTCATPIETKPEEPQPEETKSDEKKAESMFFIPRLIFLFFEVLLEHLHLIPKFVM